MSILTFLAHNDLSIHSSELSVVLNHARVMNWLPGIYSASERQRQERFFVFVRFLLECIIRHKKFDTE